MTKTSYDKLRTKVLGVIEGLTLSDSKYFEVRKLFCYAETIHCNLRRDGAKEFSHQLEMLALALSLHDMISKPREVYMAILGHDLLEDYPDTLRYLSQNHPEAVDYSSRLAKFKDKDGRYEQYFEEIALCEVCSIVKLVDRVHNLSTAVGVFKPAKLIEYVDEVHEYFVPMYRKAKSMFNQRSAYEVLKTMLLIECNTITKFQKIVDELQSAALPSLVTEFVESQKEE